MEMDERQGHGGDVGGRGVRGWGLLFESIFFLPNEVPTAEFTRSRSVMPVIKVADPGSHCCRN